MEEENVPQSGFNFDTWATDIKLPRKVMQTLRQEELITKEALTLVSESDLRTIGLPLGSIKVLLQEVKLWRSENTQPELQAEATVAAGTSNAITLDSAGRLFDDLLATGIPRLETAHPQTNAEIPFMDPRSILTLKAQSRKTVHITQFLSENSRRRRQNRRKEYVLRSDAEETLVLKTEEEHPYLGILIEEWGAANMRLLNHLLVTKEIERGDIEFYLAYTTRIFEFSANYEWNSILNYDCHYRELQAEHQFKWGTFSPHMELQLLIPRRTKTTLTAPPSQNEDCRIFKSKGTCPFGTKCRYRHAKSTEPEVERKYSTGPKNYQPDLRH